MHRIGMASLLGLSLLACNKQAEEAQSGNVEATQEAAAPAPEPSPFSPPADGLLKPAQAKSFLLAHQALVKVNEIFLDRLETAGPEARKEILSSLERARDKAARKYGLNGYAEYRWILEEAPRHPENAALLRQAGVGVVGR